MSRVAVERAMYSLSVVDSAISVWSLLLHVTGQTQNLITKPVRERTLSRSSAYSLCHHPAKSASTNMSRDKSAVGRNNKPLSLVPSKYQIMRFIASS
jgi:hypothetical protein